MSPYEIRILLDYYTMPGDPEAIEAPIGPDTLKCFIADGLLWPNPEGSLQLYRLTEKGEFYVKAGICNVPLPVQEFRIPARDGDKHAE